MKKLTLTIAAVLTATVIGGGVYAGTASNVCNYTESGDYRNSDGTLSAFGTMAAASQCAASGILPAVVARRLGSWGDADTQEWAEEIKKLDAEQKQKIKERAEVKAEK
jgi:hypothetical protein